MADYDTVSNIYDSVGSCLGTVWRTRSADGHFMTTKYDVNGRLLTVEHERKLPPDFDDIDKLLADYRDKDAIENAEVRLGSKG